MIDGVALTREIIKRYDFRDSAGRLHVPHGLFTMQATLYAHVCFDRHGDLGRRCWWGPVERLRLYVLSSGIRPRYGSFPGQDIKATGSGYLVDPVDAGMKSFCIENLCSGLKEDKDGAVELVRRALGGASHANLEQQKKGIDLIRDRDGETLEVKSRFRDYDKIFVQLGETNPYGAV